MNNTKAFYPVRRRCAREWYRKKAMQVIEKMEKRRELIETAATQVDRDVIEERGQ